MTRDTPLRRAGRASALLLTGLALVATMDSALNQPVEFDVTGSCGPAGRIVIDPGDQRCGADPTALLGGGASVGLPPYAVGVESTFIEPENGLILSGPVVLPGSEPPLTVHRTCQVGLEVAGVRTFTCDGDHPEAACDGTLTRVQAPAPKVAP